MPQPPGVQSLADPLINAYQSAWERVLAEQERLLDDPRQWRRSRRLEEVSRSIGSIMDDLDGETADWVSRQFPRAYGAGLADGAAAAGTSPAWSMIHQEAVERLAYGVYDDLLAATTHVRSTTKDLIRTLARQEGIFSLVSGRTATDSGTALAREMARNGIAAVIYKDGSRHGLADYANMNLRTTTALGYNNGTLNAAPDVVYWEVFDGPGCGWAAHDDTEQALGKIVTRDDALAFPISHPRCRRAFGPRPDLNKTASAGEGLGSVTPSQVAAQRTQDAERLARQARAASRRRAGGRPPRQPRAARKAPAPKPSNTSPVGVRRLAKPKSAPPAPKPIPTDLQARIDRVNRRTVRRPSGQNVPLGKLSPEARRAYLSAKEKQDLDQYLALRRPPAAQRRIPSQPVLNAADKQAIYNYAWDYETYNRVNRALRAGDLTDTSADVERYTRLLSQHELDVDTTVHRVMSFDDPDEFNKFLAMKTGDTFTDPAFMSTALDRTKAEEFDVFAHNVQLEIDAPKGTKAIHIGDMLDGMPGSYDQTEVLFQRGTVMEVVGSTLEGKTLRLKVRAVEQPVWPWESP
jgi:hypothetical protein